MRKLFNKIFRPWIELKQMDELLRKQEDVAFIKQNNRIKHMNLADSLLTEMLIDLVSETAARKLLRMNKKLNNLAMNRELKNSISNSKISFRQKITELQMIVRTLK